MVFVAQIIRNKTYSSKEAADLLGMNINTFQKLAREEKIRVYMTGKNYRVTGAALMDYMGLPSGKSKEELLEEFHKVSEQLQPILNKEGKDYGVFLHQSISMHVDTVGLEKIIADLKRYIELSQK